MRQESWVFVRTLSDFIRFVIVDRFMGSFFESGDETDDRMAMEPAPWKINFLVPSQGSSRDHVSASWVGCHVLSLEGIGLSC